MAAKTSQKDVKLIRAKQQSWSGQTQEMIERYDGLPKLVYLWGSEGLEQAGREVLLVAALVTTRQGGAKTVAAGLSASDQRDDSLFKSLKSEIRRLQSSSPFFHRHGDIKPSLLQRSNTYMDAEKAVLNSVSFTEQFTNKPQFLNEEETFRGHVLYKGEVWYISRRLDRSECKLLIDEQLLREQRKLDYLTQGVAGSHKREAIPENVRAEVAT